LPKNDVNKMEGINNKQQGDKQTKNYLLHSHPRIYLKENNNK